MKVGIDVSKWQVDIDWVTVRAHVDFAYIRVSDGVYNPDPYLDRNVAGCRATDLPYGVYQLFEPGVDMFDQFALFVELVGPHCGQLPPAMDLEVSKITPAMAAAWLLLVEEQYLRVPAIYGSSGVLPDYLGGQQGFSRHPLWVADYSGAKAPRVPAPWSEWTIWQTTNEGRVPGIHTTVDLNTCRDEDLTALLNKIVVTSGSDE